MEKPLSEMESQDRSAVQQLIDRERKTLEEKLKEAWDKEGSPFQGQPFDPGVLG